MRWYQPVFFLSLLAALPTSACTANTGDPGGCATDSDCKGTRICVNGQCIDPGGNAGNGGSNAGNGGSNAGFGGGNTGNGGGNTGNGGSNTGSGGNVGSSCSGDACSCTTGGGLTCCSEGTVKAYDCDATCAAYGYEGDGCQSDTCQCGAPTDQACAQGVAAFCKCGEWAGSAPCTSTEETNMYENCHTGTKLTAFLKCWGQQINGSNIDCASAVTACDQYAP